mgnify:CR=1 FL=1
MLKITYLFFIAYTNLGGQLSHVEVSKVKGTGKLLITGLAGDVLLESAKVVKKKIECRR